MTTRQTPLTSSELATLWVVYQKKSMMVQVIGHFVSMSEDTEVEKILRSFREEEIRLVHEISDIFEQEGAVVPVGFTEHDLNPQAPRLFDDLFAAMYLRLMMGIASGIHAIHISMSYRKDITQLFRKFSVFAGETYEKTTQLLLQRGALSKSPYVTLPRQVEFAEQTDYRTGMKLFGHRRTLNTLEVAYLHEAIEANVTGMKLMTGFGQVAQEEAVR